MKKHTCTLLLFLAALAFAGCKPTEQNYKSAYDVAQRKRAADAAADAELGVPPGALQRFDAPQRRAYGGDTLFVRYERLQWERGLSASDKNEDSLPGNLGTAGSRPSQEGTLPPQERRLPASAVQPGSRTDAKINVAVGMYSMPTNAKAQVEALRKEGYPAATAANADGKHYALAAAFAAAADAAHFVREYMATHPEAEYLGLPQEPVIIISPSPSPPTP